MILSDVNIQIHVIFLRLCQYTVLQITDGDDSRGSKAFIRVCLCVCLSAR